jgi:xylulokinase
MEVEEGAAFGAALLGGVAAGVFADVESAIDTCVRPGAVVDPVDAWVEPYRERLETFRALYPALRDLP